VIVLDVMMPGMDGIETLRKIKAHNSKIPVIMLSSSDSREIMAQSEAAGATEFISKAELCQNTAHWVDKIVNTYGRRARAA